MSKRSGNYLRDLNDLMRQYMMARPNEKPKDGDWDNEKGELTETGARNLHRALCESNGLGMIDTIRDWNSRMPKNDQW